MRITLCFILLLACLAVLPGAAPVPTGPVELIALRTATSRTWANPDGSYTGEFHVDQEPIHRWVPLVGWVPIDSFDGPMIAASGLLLADTYNGTTYTGADSTGSGYLDADNATWATLRALADGMYFSRTAGLSISSDCVATGYDLCRGFSAFNTAAVGGGATIRTGTYAFTPNSNTWDNAGGVYVVASTQSTPTNLYVQDYDQVGTSSFGYMASGSISLNVANTITLAGTWVGSINKSGYTTLAVREKHDFENIQPGGPATKRSRFGCGVVKWPTLTLNYDHVEMRAKNGVW